MQSGAWEARNGSEAVVGMESSHRDRGIDYIEFNVADIGRSKDFYGKAFGWTFTDYGPDYCEFSDGHMRGGFAAGGPVTPGGPLVVLYGADLADGLDRIEAAGGRIVKPVFEFPGGRRFHFVDPDGYELAVWSET
jgi:hypothetical protein